MTVPDHDAYIAATGPSASKTGITFPPTRTVPADLVERLVLASRKEVGQTGIRTESWAVDEREGCECGG